MKSKSKIQNKVNNNESQVTINKDKITIKIKNDIKMI